MKSMLMKRWTMPTLEPVPKYMGTVNAAVPIDRVKRLQPQVDKVAKENSES